LLNIGHFLGDILLLAPGMSLKIVPIFRDQARAYVRERHRHHLPSLGAVFYLAVSDGEDIVGVAMIGRPTARRLQDGLTLEVLRVCTDGTKNACSMLYGAAWRVARNLGYNRLVTFILHSEPGTSVEAAGFHCINKTKGGSWDRPTRQRIDKAPIVRKIRYERNA
jgi:hypothetical protein